jgi:hypothetical protein
MLAIIVGVLAAFTLLVWLAVEVKALTDQTRVPTEEELRRAATLFRILAVVMSGSVLGVALWIGHFAWRVHKFEVYPPPGSRQMRVRRVLRGAEARRVSSVCFVIAGLLAAAGAWLAPLVFRLLSAMGLDRY